MKQVSGNLEGLSYQKIKQLEKLFKKRIPNRRIVSPELAKRVIEISLDIKRQVGLLVDRSGKVEHVVVGDRKSIFLPNLSEGRTSPQRLLGLRYIHTHVDDEPFTEEDITDLLFLRFDLMAVLRPTEPGHPPKMDIAYIYPTREGREVKIEEGGIVYNWEDFDFVEHVKNLEDELKKVLVREGWRGRDRAILVGIGTRKRDVDNSLDELEALARTSDIDVVDRFYHHESRIHPKFLIGIGKLKELTIRSLEKGANMAIFDRDLYPIQAHSISDVTGLKVIDRTQLILDIFAQRAKTREGKIQVELAQLRYLYPRLIHRGTAMSRLMGGIGGRGPGETKLEQDRRKLKDRISKLERTLERIARERKLRRARRRRSNIPIVSIVGYTNAGKSTLFNALTKASVLVEDKLFATLEPTTRRLVYPTGERIILTDTVGFIERLPEDLIKAFRATLEELFDADYLIHIVDISDENWQKKLKYVKDFLENMGLFKEEILVFNKVDLVKDVSFLKTSARSYGAYLLSAIDKNMVKDFAEYLRNRVFKNIHGELIHGRG